MTLRLATIHTKYVWVRQVDLLILTPFAVGDGGAATLGGELVDIEALETLVRSGAVTTELKVGDRIHVPSLGGATIATASNGVPDMAFCAELSALRAELAGGIPLAEQLRVAAEGGNEGDIRGVFALIPVHHRKYLLRAIAPLDQVVLQHVRL